MPRTGEKCPESGVYKCTTCTNTIPLAEDQTFPPCSVEGGKAVTWVLQRKV